VTSVSIVQRGEPLPVTPAIQSAATAGAILIKSQRRRASAGGQCGQRESGTTVSICAMVLSLGFCNLSQELLRESISRLRCSVYRSYRPLPAAFLSRIYSRLL